MHDPTPIPKHSYCNLYGGKCGWDARISKYEPNWTGLGENICELWIRGVDSTKLALQSYGQFDPDVPYTLQSPNPGMTYESEANNPIAGVVRDA